MASLYVVMLAPALRALDCLSDEIASLEQDDIGLVPRPALKLGQPTPSERAAA
jgi:hypothetical protein